VASAVEMIVRFREVTGRDIGLLVEAPDAQPQPEEPGRLLRPWGLKVVAMSDAPHRLPLLARAALDQPGVPPRREPVQVEDGSRHYAIKLFPIGQFTAYGRGYFAVVSDITDEVLRIRAAAWSSLLAGVGGLAVSELVLFLILSAPLTRLQRTSRVLPLLARDGFAEVRASLSRHRRKRGLPDEIDQLDETSLELALQLETLNSKVGERTDALKLRMRELDRERSFVSSLLDTAQVIILTQHRDGRIGLANRYALQMTGYALEDLVARPFTSLLNPADARAASAELERLGRHELAHFSHEAEMTCANGRRLQLAWFHSALDAGGEDGAAVLSAGLDITDRKHAERRVAWFAEHDPLTGLFNRRRFEAVLQQALRLSVEDGNGGGALMYVDLDEFKIINDTLGHSAGDKVLEAFSGHLARLGEVIAPGRRTLTARLGGDEFAVIVEEVDRGGALHAAERLREGINRLEYSVGAEVFRITCSIGVALYPQHGLGFQELMQNADLAMYQAKNLGQGRVQLFSGDEAMRLHMAQRRRWKERIDAALGADRLVLHFQPIMELRGRRVTHYEALVRMLDSDDGLIPPGDFIPVAEATGQITAIDCRVLELVFDAAERLRQCCGLIGIHINLSARSLQTSEWWGRLNELLEGGGVEPSSLVFEVTETAAVTDLKDARSLMEAVRNKGCAFALDDFGVGFSSFNYIKELPVDLVKIDGAFITHLSDRPDHQLVVKALVDVARGFGKRTVAEFVDSADTLNLISQLGVDFAQGFHVGKPVPEDALGYREAGVGEPAVRFLPRQDG
jgi:diguanylate cyclase (GGDEF)-like protein/PAS domain S-box-containing protein